MKEIRNMLLIGLPMGALMLLQWPFKAVSNLLDLPIDKLHDKAEREMGPPR
jgi:hypothetical protein